MDIIEIFKIGSVLILGCIIQSSSGFGFGLFAIPILLFFGFDLPATVAMVMIGSAIQKVMALNYLKNAVDWKTMIPFMLTGLLSLPLGIYGMFRVSAMDQSVVMQVIGILVLLLLVMRWKGRIKTREIVPSIWGYTAGFFSGLLNGFANIGGPPLVLWTLSHQWSNRKMRGTIIAFALIFVPFQVALMLYAFGIPLINPMVKMILLSPTVLLGTWLGLKIGEKISKDHLKIYMQVLLFFIAISSIAKPFL